MDMDLLRRVAGAGLENLDPAAARSLGIWLTDWCEQGGDGRYCILGDALQSLDDWREQHEEAGGVPTYLLAEIDSELVKWLPEIMRAKDPASGAALATVLKREIMVRLLPTNLFAEIDGGV